MNLFCHKTDCSPGSEKARVAYPKAKKKLPAQTSQRSLDCSI